ncbi:hypothetical protein T439DRAFT_327370 [Meredithblackwellia eburnea MCA 4105]
MSTAEHRRQRNKAADDEDASLLKFGPDFTDGKTAPLTISEVMIILERRAADEQHPSDSPVFLKTSDYVHTFARFQDQATVEQVRTLLSQTQLFQDFELAQLANLCPADADEAKSLIPSLSEMDDDVLQPILNDLNAFKGQF